MQRRGFLRGLFAAPAVVAYERWKGKEPPTVEVEPKADEMVADEYVGCDPYSNTSVYTYSATSSNGYWSSASTVGTHYVYGGTTIHRSYTL